MNRWKCAIRLTNDTRARRQRLREEHFWIVTEHGYGDDYVKNLPHEPRMRVKVGRTWHRGTAHILPDDDALQRLRWLRRPVNDAVLLLVGTQQPFRVDLDLLPP